MASGSGTRADPWMLTTAPGTFDYQMWRDEAALGLAELTHDAKNNRIRAR